MPHHPPLYEWADRVATRFPDLPTATARTLAEYSYGLVLARACGRTAVALALAAVLGQVVNTVRPRLREFYPPADVTPGRGRTQLDPADGCGPLARSVTAGWADTWAAVAPDATTPGDRFTASTGAVVSRGCAVPVAWAVPPADTAGAGHPHGVALRPRASAALGAGWPVAVRTDRGLASPAPFRAVVGRGMHPRMRITARAGPSSARPGGPSSTR